MSIVKTPKGTEIPLINLKGKLYLTVQYRLVWFREERPDWSLENDFLEINDNYSIARCVVKDQGGRIIAIAHKREDVKHFADYIEKSQTSAIGRALALCGYGTQFTDDLEEGERLADNPTPKGNRPATHSSLQVTAEERKALTELAFSTGWTREWVVQQLNKRYNVNSTTELTRAQFNEFKQMIIDNPQKKEGQQ